MLQPLPRTVGIWAACEMAVVIIVSASLPAPWKSYRQFNKRDLRPDPQSFDCILSHTTPYWTVASSRTVASQGRPVNKLTDATLRRTSDRVLVPVQPMRADHNYYVHSSTVSPVQISTLALTTDVELQRSSFLRSLYRVIVCIDH